MKYALIGYGKMGKELINILGANNLTFILDPKIKNISNLNNTKLYKNYQDLINIPATDIIFDFSSYHNVIRTLTYLFKNNLNLKVISGTTNFDPNALKAVVLKSKSLFLHANNFSMSMQLLYKLYELISSKKKPYFSYSLLEFHHKHKKDKPSGTAKNLAKILNIKDLSIEAVRAGSYPGTHSLFIDANYETIELTHTVRDRKVFCEGAINAAGFLIKQKKPGIYNLADVFKE